jgi:hypothetical protein
MWQRLALFAFLLTCILDVRSACAQVKVHVEVTTNKRQYLAGEPIFIEIRTTNIGGEALGFSDCEESKGLELTVEGAKKKGFPNFYGCGNGVFTSSECGLSGLPEIAVGQTKLSRHMIRGYHLVAGTYSVHATGSAGIYRVPSPRKQANTIRYDSSDSRDTPESMGVSFDVSIPINIRAGTEDELREVYEPFFADAQSPDSKRRYEARAAITEMAVPMFESVIEGFGADPSDASNAWIVIKALGEINSPDSRRFLIHLFETAPEANLSFRRQVITELGFEAAPENAVFFSEILSNENVPGGMDPLQFHQFNELAASGLGAIGGDDAVELLRTSPPSGDPFVRAAVASALGNTRTPSAVPALIDLYSDGDPRVRKSVCEALQALTHLQWCDASESNAVSQADLRLWWQLHGPATKIYGPDNCPGKASSLQSIIEIH